MTASGQCRWVLLTRRVRPSITRTSQNACHNTRKQAHCRACVAAALSPHLRVVVDRVCVGEQHAPPLVHRHKAGGRGVVLPLALPGQGVVGLGVDAVHLRHRCEREGGVSWGCGVTVPPSEVWAGHSCALDFADREASMTSIHMVDATLAALAMTPCQAPPSNVTATHSTACPVLRPTRAPDQITCPPPLRPQPSPAPPTLTTASMYCAREMPCTCSSSVSPLPQGPPSPDRCACATATGAGAGGMPPFVSAGGGGAATPLPALLPPPFPFLGTSLGPTSPEA